MTFQIHFRLQMLVILTLLLFFSLISTQVISQDQLQTSAIQQINALLIEKRARTSAQNKLGSGLLLEVKRQKNDPILQSLPMLQNQARIEIDGSVQVDIKAKVSDSLLNIIINKGGRIVNQHPKFGSIRAYIPLDKLEEIAGLVSVRSIFQAYEPQTNMINTTEGDVAHASNTARTTFNVTGAGVRVCAISDSIEQLAALQASGDLPATVDVLAGQSGVGSSEGTALLEIIHDIAPDADLSFSTASGGEAQFAQNILDLQTSGCDVIIDDVSYFSEAVFQDGIVAQAVDTVTRAGALYFSSAGNSGNLNSGTSGVWEGDYVGTALPAPLLGVGLSAHEFDSGVNSNIVTKATSSPVTLQWNDPFNGTASNDYDLYLLDAGLNNVLGTSFLDQANNPLPPIEAIQGPIPVGARLVVVLFSGVPGFIHLNTNRGELQFGTDGQISGHFAANSAITVAAVNVATAGGGVFTGGGANPVESFSSDGPRIIFFNPDSTPVTSFISNPSGLILNGGPVSELRQKPDVTAADGVLTATPGFNPFFGTSASAPHVAAISGLLREKFPSTSFQGLNDLFSSSALDIEVAGFDRDSGAGIIMADEVIGTPIFSDGFESGDTSAWTNN